MLSFAKKKLKHKQTKMKTNLKPIIHKLNTMSM